MTRFHRTASLALVLAFAPGVGFPGDTAKDPHAQHARHDAGESQDGHASTALPDEALPARRWLPDAPLSSGMQRVRALTRTLEHGSHGHLDDAQVRVVAAQLKSAVDMMFAQCKLEPGPDAALHPLLARVLLASNKLAEVGFDDEALAELQAVLARYPRLFDDPAWTATPAS